MLWLVHSSQTQNAILLNDEAMAAEQKSTSRLIQKFPNGYSLQRIESLDTLRKALNSTASPPGTEAS